ncbi:MAG: hypothetical protein V4542_13930 [Pseudomonadota bacterium]
MIPNSKKAAVLRAVAMGATIAEAGTAAGLSAWQAKESLRRLRRELGLDTTPSEIQASPQKYLKALQNFESKPQFDLRGPLVDKLVSALRLKSASDLTPAYLSNISASQLLSCGVTLVAVAELQEWLENHELSLKRNPPATGADVKAAERAILLLDAFFFDTETVRAQLANLQNSV